MAAQTWTPEYAQSVVDCMEWCLNATSEEHRWEVEDERWQDELGDRPAMYLGAAVDGAHMPFFMAQSAWAYASFPTVRAMVDKELI